MPAHQDFTFKFLSRSVVQGVVLIFSLGLAMAVGKIVARWALENPGGFAFGLGVATGGLIPTGLVSRVLLWVLRRWGEQKPKLFLAHGVSLIVCVLLGTIGFGSFARSLWYTLSQAVWLEFDFWRRRRNAKPASLPTNPFEGGRTALMSGKTAGFKIASSDLSNVLLRPLADITNWVRELPASTVLIVAGMSALGCFLMTTEYVPRPGLLWNIMHSEIHLTKVECLYSAAPTSGRKAGLFDDIPDKPPAGFIAPQTQPSSALPVSNSFGQFNQPSTAAVCWWALPYRAVLATISMLVALWAITRRRKKITEIRT